MSKKLFGKKKKAPAPEVEGGPVVKPLDAADPLARRVKRKDVGSIIRRQVEDRLGSFGRLGG